jgi:beta-mannosidase
MREIDLCNGWQVLQDVHDNAELLGLFQPDYKPYPGTAISNWEPIEKLTHLQLLFAEQPYFGRELRYFNEHAWWYRLEFDCDAALGKMARLRFEGVDYFAQVWLNGQLLGEHEGYFEAFEFPVEKIIQRGGRNVLVVKVSAPWDKQTAPGCERDRAGTVLRNLIKGTYEHCDTFVQRDVNSVGIWRPVKLLASDDCLPAGQLYVATKLAANGARAELNITWPVEARAKNDAEVVVRISDGATNKTVAETAKMTALAPGVNELSVPLVLDAPRLWSTWDRGGAALYRAHVGLRVGGCEVLSAENSFGVRTVDLRRTEKETAVILNGEKLFIRGTTYFPDVYLSKLDRSRYQRDLEAIVRAGMNAVRVHVHVENPEFYALCDRLGILVLQDSDLNWWFPTDDAFQRRAEKVFKAMIARLKQHPSIFAWVCTNETNTKDAGMLRFSAALAEVAHAADPSRPTIRNSWANDDLASGDVHDYAGSLGGKAYTDIFTKHHKFLSEFGADAPACTQNLLSVPGLRRLGEKLAPRIPELHAYQYRLLKYQIESVRIHKYDPSSGFFHFMWIDLCPQSFYGVYDYWGVPKVEGLGGGLRAFEEANAPVGIFMAHLDGPVALWAVNDYQRDLGACRAEWTVTTQSGEVVTRGDAQVTLGPDSRARVSDLKFTVQKDERYEIALVLFNADGKIIARNRYHDPFHHPSRLPGYPERIDHETGMRMWSI